MLRHGPGVDVAAAAVDVAAAVLDGCFMDADGVLLSAAVTLDAASYPSRLFEWTPAGDASAEPTALPPPSLLARLVISADASRIVVVLRSHGADEAARPPAGRLSRVTLTLTAHALVAADAPLLAVVDALAVSAHRQALRLIPGVLERMVRVDSDNVMPTASDRIVAVRRAATVAGGAGAWVPLLATAAEAVEAARAAAARGNIDVAALSLPTDDRAVSGGVDEWTAAVAALSAMEAAANAAVAARSAVTDDAVQADADTDTPLVSGVVAD